MWRHKKEKSRREDEKNERNKWQSINKFYIAFFTTEWFIILNLCVFIDFVIYFLFTIDVLLTESRLAFSHPRLVNIAYNTAPRPPLSSFFENENNNNNSSGEINNMRRRLLQQIYSLWLNSFIHIKWDRVNTRAYTLKTIAFYTIP